MTSAENYALASCEDCHHVFPVAYPPMAEDELAVVMSNTHCRNCGAPPSKVAAASEEERAAFEASQAEGAEY